VLTACLGLGWALLDQGRFRDLGTHVAAGVGFVANLLLWHQSGYFDAAAEEKPLLHLWSLGIEEQFYFALPLLLWATWRRPRLPLRAIALAGAASFALCAVLTYGDRTAAFYSPFARAWELLIGSALALLQVSIGRRSVREITALTGCALLTAALLLLDRRSAFPGIAALMPTLGAIAIIVAGRDTLVGRALSSGPLVSIGLISYPLYLWHWPLLVFARSAYLATPPAAVPALALVLSFALAWLTYRLVEVPIRHAPTRSIVPRLVGAVAAIGVVGFGIRAADGVPSRASANAENHRQLQWPHVSSDACLGRLPPKPDLDWTWWGCNLSRPSEPTLVIPGSSHANHLYPGVANHRELAHQTVLNLGSCDPISEVRITPPRDSVSTCGGARTLEASRYVLDVVERLPSVRYAILSAPLFRTEELTPGTEAAWGFSATSPDEMGGTPKEIYLRGLSRYIARLEQHDVTVIVALDTPRMSHDVLKCLAPLFLGERPDCAPTRMSVDTTRAASIEIVERLVKEHPGVLVFDPLPAFCDARSCPMIRAGRPLLRDSNHLSELGSSIWADAFVEWARVHKPELLGALAEHRPP
jgi:peptidoglycan/LPS O-acetylase OafA/YrhL